MFMHSQGSRLTQKWKYLRTKIEKWRTKKNVCVNVTHSFVHLFFLVLSDRSASVLASRRKGKRSSTRIKVFCVVSLDMSMRIVIAPVSLFPEHRENVAPHLAIKRTQNNRHTCGWLSKMKKWLPFFKVKSHFVSWFWNPRGTLQSLSSPQLNWPRPDDPGPALLPCLADSSTPRPDDPGPAVLPCLADSSTPRPDDPGPALLPCLADRSTPSTPLVGACSCGSDRDWNSWQACKHWQ